MPLKYIIDTLSREIGLHPINQRAVALNRINQAAKELYESTDLPGSLREATFEITSAQIMALPYYVGPLRAMTNKNSLYRVELKDMLPRYSYQPWTEGWNNWRILNASPIQTSIVNSAVPINLSITAIDSIPIIITLVGKTTSAQRVRETVTILAGETTVSCSQQFTELYSITKNVTNNKNITVTGKDILGADLILAIIPNDRFESIYTIVDVSQYPGLSSAYMDVLFKFPLFEMINDGDTFPCDGFDDAIIYKCLHIFYANQADGGEKAIGYFNKVNQIIFERTNHVTGTTQKQITFAPNPLFSIIPKYGLGSWPYIGRRYR